MSYNYSNSVRLCLSAKMMLLIALNLLNKLSKIVYTLSRG